MSGLSYHRTQYRSKIPTFIQNPDNELGSRYWYFFRSVDVLCIVYVSEPVVSRIPISIRNHYIDYKIRYRLFFRYPDNLLTAFAFAFGCVSYHVSRYQSKTPISKRNFNIDIFSICVRPLCYVGGMGNPEYQNIGGILFGGLLESAIALGGEALALPVT